MGCKIVDVLEHRVHATFAPNVHPSSRWFLSSLLFIFCYFFILLYSILFYINNNTIINIKYIYIYRDICAGEALMAASGGLLLGIDGIRYEYSSAPSPNCISYSVPSANNSSSSNVSQRNTHGMIAFYPALAQNVADALTSCHFALSRT